jgi:hypothetical protein
MVTLMGKREPAICSTCGTIGQPATAVSGSIGVEFLLWLCLLLPGLIYSLWRLSTKKQVCSSCKAATLVPLASPVGQRLQLEMSATRPIRG